MQLAFGKFFFNANNTRYETLLDTLTFFINVKGVQTFEIKCEASTSNQVLFVCLLVL